MPQPRFFVHLAMGQVFGLFYAARSRPSTSRRGGSAACSVWVTASLPWRSSCRSCRECTRVWPANAPGRVRLRCSSRRVCLRSTTGRRPPSSRPVRTLRTAWSSGCSSIRERERTCRSIGDYGLIGDTRSAALVAPDGSIDWCCLPRFDDPPVFGRLVGGDAAGWLALGPTGEAAPAGQRYRGNTATLVTTWWADGAQIVLEDSMVAEVRGSLLPASVLVRRISCLGLDMPVILRYSPRFGYSRDRRGGSRHGTVRSSASTAISCSHSPPTAQTRWSPTGRSSWR